MFITYTHRKTDIKGLDMFSLRLASDTGVGFLSTPISLCLGNSETIHTSFSHGSRLVDQKHCYVQSLSAQTHYAGRKDAIPHSFLELTESLLFPGELLGTGQSSTKVAQQSNFRQMTKPCVDNAPGQLGIKCH